MDFIAAAADLYTRLNWAHVFRDGNRRTTRLFLTRVTSDANWRFDFSSVSGREWARACQAGAPMNYRPPTDPARLLRAFDTITVLRPDIIDQLPPVEPASPTRDLPTAAADGIDIAATVAAAVTAETTPTGDEAASFPIEALLPEPDAGTEPSP